MYVSDLNSAVQEAKRFLERAEYLESLNAQRNGYYDRPVFTAAVKRASLDLTRALAALRRR